MDVKDYMYRFVDEISVNKMFIDDTICEQLRCLFTTYCIMNDVESDTSTCDWILEDIYNRIYHITSMSFDNFYNHMVEYIV